MRLVDAELAAVAADVTRGTLRVWVHRGRLRRYGTAGVALYDLDELVALVCGR